MSNSTPVKPAVTAVPPSLMPIIEAPDLYADALLTDDRNSLLFLSLWGRDTAIQQLLAQMSVSIESGGIRELHLRTDKGPASVHLDRIEMLEKHTARMPQRNLFGDLVHLWIYDRMAVEPDRANRRALLLYRPDQESGTSTNERIWSLVRDVCHVPLLPHWRKAVLSILETHKWMQRIDGHGIAAWEINLGEPQLEAEISQMVRNGDLTLSDADPGTALTVRRALAA